MCVPQGGYLIYTGMGGERMGLKESVFNNGSECKSYNPSRESSDGYCGNDRLTHWNVFLTRT